MFVLALTSNKEGPEVQHARTEDGALVAGRMLDHLRQLNAGESPLGSFGAVIGATIGDSELDFDFNGPILAPGFGAQGGTVADIRRIFGRRGRRGHAELVARAAAPRARRSRRCATRRCGSTTSWDPCERGRHRAPAPSVGVAWRWCGWARTRSRPEG